ncbi:DUF397 domain-containing protein [Streptomyces sp. NBC_01244]|uniref:DUF397 domain-containing protein n=1 Tax=Streptomyces sp. NBC_01244 TaxID=2903797 RepID=UPI002E14E5F7|nr:DUF397 domain-containing protein [Streptomyces sp. NBC_01244]
MNAHDIPGWFKSSYSGGVNDSCVEINPTAAPAVLVRDSKVTNGPVLRVSVGAWSDLVGLVRADV